MAPAHPRREPIFKLPGVIIGLFLFMALVQVGQEMLSPGQDARFLALLAFVPGRFTYAFDPAGVAASLRALSGDTRQVGLFFLGDGGGQPWTPLTYAFLHGGWVHLLTNSVWLAAFGAPVARRFGPLRFLALFSVASIAGALAQWVAQPFALIPVVGASAGISGVMAAAVRFVFQPGAPLGAMLADEDAERAYQRAPLSLIQTFQDARAVIFIVIWFIVNLAFGLAAEPLGITSAAIAWQAHIGGFAAGLVFFTLFDPFRAEPGADSRHGPSPGDVPLQTPPDPR